VRELTIMRGPLAVWNVELAHHAPHLRSPATPTSGSCRQLAQSSTPGVFVTKVDLLERRTGSKYGIWQRL